MEFRSFLDTYINTWIQSSLTDLRNMISEDYQAREISGGQIIDFGYEESIKGWEQGFTYVLENQAEWKIHEVSTIPLREDEVMAVLEATLVIDGKSLHTANLFFQTFKKRDDNNWKLVRSYIEAGIQKNR
ncbi:flavoprotein [Bacillus sp. 31A1R]|uniref:Flavoprotein n=1 Tax=Robertmurraya mangrovi TaxID=3098077 RepID=A0ABU5IVX9_9BACI|nr:flavoprotein [Bacillus sp. 31A1R]MDZ5471309.1 flavoprotein [Bacillus sp. 31A1R]